jgi:CRISPR-associated protein Cas6
VTEMATMIDVAFPLAGRYVPRDHAEALLSLLSAKLPWLTTDAHCGIHAIKLSHGLAEPALLPGRARLMMRVNRDRLGEMQALDGFSGEIAGNRIVLGAPQARELVAHGTVYAYKVAAESADEAHFMAEVVGDLGKLDITGVQICGKRQQISVAGRVLEAFSLMLHQLTPVQSIRIQEIGLGPHRLLGCGLFVPHKSASAV